MDTIYDYLKLDHQKVAKLFELYKSAPTEINKIEIVAMINKELTVHLAAEENTFYKPLEKHSESRKDVLHGEKEHQEIKELLALLMRMKKGDGKMDAKVLALKDAVEHHVSEEEGKIFKDAKSVFSDEEAIILKYQMHDLKGKLILEKFNE